MMAHRFRLALLGGFEVSTPAGSALKVSTRKAQGLLAYLGSRVGMECERDRLAGLLWGDRDEDHARNSLRQTLFLLRRLTEASHPQLLNITNHTVSLNASSVDVDVRSFEESARSATPTALQRAAELYRGDLLDGFTVDETPFEEWLLRERERLRELAMDGLGRLLQWQRGNRQIDDAIRTCRRLLGLEPWQEPVHRTLMRLLVQAGQPTAALRHYQQCQELLKRDLGVEPEPETRLLFETIRGRHAAGDGGRVEAMPLAEVAADLPVAAATRVSASRGVARARLVDLQLQLSRQIIKLSRQYVTTVRMVVDESRRQRIPPLLEAPQVGKPWEPAKGRLLDGPPHE